MLNNSQRLVRIYLGLILVPFRSSVHNNSTNTDEQVITLFFSVKDMSIITAELKELLKKILYQ
jgi:hypothetical protein